MDRELGTAVGNAVIDMYAKCGLVDKAKEVFDKLSARNVILWTTLIAGYVQQEFAKDALDCLEKMVLEGISPNNVTYACSLKACTILGATCKGGELHAQAARSSLFKQDTTLQRTLVEMYAKSGLLSKAHEVFNTLSARDLSSWNTLMAGYAHLGDSANVLQIFEKLKRDGPQPDLSSFSHLLSVCSITGMLHSAHMFLHSMDDDYSMTPTIEHYTAIIDLYGRLGYVDMARFLVKQLPFDPDKEKKMFDYRYLKSDQMFEGKYLQLHDAIMIRMDRELGTAVGNAVIDMYAKCGLVDKAKEVFDKLSARNVILWTTLIAGYVQQEFAKDALDCLEKMVLEGISPNNVTYACSLKACTILGATCKGGELHAQAARSSLFKQDTTLQRTLVEMYAKSGLLSKAHEVFNTLSARDLSSWNTLMAGYAHLGDSANVLQIFEKLKRDGLQPDLSSFSHLLSVCSITGMLHSAHMFLHSMDDDYSMTPTIEHYTAIIDLYGRLGYVDMARFLVKQLPFDPDKAVWHTLLDACHKGGGSLSRCYHEQIKGGFLVLWQLSYTWRRSEGGGV
ncbi:hypothetical protein KP509_20G075700 [Ceratopteris richardii]|uniref:Pentatricopeptide repeat-containing protein n=1 Tax=Ceratopteris richardii TaxID=49495 RepID=A0A8T2SJT0_CERRI|nr:hypothetical protein KP509_20G075700 [Ceratopteris richardii]